MQEKIEIKKHIERPIVKNVFLLEFSLDINDCKDQLIKLIDDSVEGQVNNNYQTNVKGKMTPWSYFVNNEHFNTIMQKVIKKISDLKIKPNTKFYINEAWGIKLEGMEHTNIHNHEEAFFSGIVYLSDSDQLLNFPQLNIDIRPRVGSVLIFSGDLEHGTKDHVLKEPKYAIPFNVLKISEYVNLPR